MLFSIDWIGIEHQSSQAEASNQFSWSIRSINLKSWLIEHPKTWIFAKKILDLKVPFYSFYKWIPFNLISLLQPILIYIFIYNSPLLDCWFFLVLILFCGPPRSNLLSLILPLLQNWLPLLQMWLGFVHCSWSFVCFFITSQSFGVITYLPLL